MSDSDRMRELMVIDEPAFEEVMRCVFGIREQACRTFVTLLSQPGSTVAELAATLDRDRSNVNRSLSALREKELVRRERRLLESGGYVYQYTAVSLDEAKERMHEGLDAWAADVHGKIDEFGENR